MLQWPKNQVHRQRQSIVFATDLYALGCGTVGGCPIERRLCSGGASSSSACSSLGSCSGSSCEARRWLARHCPESMRSVVDSLRTNHCAQIPALKLLDREHTA